MKDIIVMGLKNIVGGVENYLLTMQRELRDSIRFICIFESAENMHEGTVTALGGKVIYVPRENGFSVYSKSLKKVLTENRDHADTVYLNVSDYSHEHLWALMTAKQLGYRVAVHAHAAQLTPVNGFLHIMAHRLFRRLSLIQVKKCTRLAVSDRAGRFMYSGQTFQVVAPGIDISRLAFNGQTREEVRTQCGCGDRFVVGFVGRLAEVKNPAMVIGIEKALCEQKPGKTMLMMVGDGPLMPDMRSLVKNLQMEKDVLFIGETNEVPKYLQAMDCMVGTSFSEGMPISIMEAQAAALPCVCAEKNYPKEIAVTDLVRMIPLESGEKAWAEAICGIMTDPDRMKKRKSFDAYQEMKQYDRKMIAKRLYSILSGELRDQ